MGVMRKLSLVAALAVSLGGAQALHAQDAQQPRDTNAHRFGGRRGPGGPGMMEHALFKNITLTDAQKAQLKQLQTSESASMKSNMEAGRADFEAMRKARESGDTTTANKLMAEQRAKMEQRFAAHAAAVRAILTPEQQKQFDANVAEAKQHVAQFGRGRKAHDAQAPTASPPTN
jgi:Spy/CpxP family protein refolding chaperone